MQRLAARASGRGHEARKALFRVGVRRGWLSPEEVEGAFLLGDLAPAERWLLVYSLRALGIEMRESGVEEGKDKPLDFPRGV